MTDHGTPESVDPHVADADHHADAHDTGHDHHDADAIGPIDWRMWAAGALGTVAAVVVIAAAVVATGFAFLGARPAA
jgi:hypothetical protein